MAPGRSAVRHLAPYAVMWLLGLLLVLFGAASWSTDERAAVALLAGPVLAVLGGRPLLRRLTILRAAVPTLSGVPVKDLRY